MHHRNLRDALRGQARLIEKYPAEVLAVGKYFILPRQKSAAAFDAALTARGAQLSAKDRARLMALVGPLDQTLLLEAGLPERPWYKSLLYAPGRFTGYGTKTMPGIREGIEDEHFDDASKFIGLTAAALKAYAAKLDQATQMLSGPPAIN